MIIFIIHIRCNRLYNKIIIINNIFICVIIIIINNIDL